MWFLEKLLVNLKEIRKPGGKSLRVWPKNQLRYEIFDIICRFCIRKSQWKFIFNHFSGCLGFGGGERKGRKSYSNIIRIEKSIIIIHN